MDGYLDQQVPYTLANVSMALFTSKLRWASCGDVVLFLCRRCMRFVLSKRCCVENSFQFKLKPSKTVATSLLNSRFLHVALKR